jgi:hypothetical protein
MGLLLAVMVTAASVDDAAAAPALFARLDGQPMGKVVRMYADSKYHNFKLVFDSNSSVFAVSPFAMGADSLASWNPGATCDLFLPLNH